MSISTSHFCEKCEEDTPHLCDTEILDWHLSSRLDSGVFVHYMFECCHCGHGDSLVKKEQKEKIHNV